jgi:hypothetical protein
MDAIALGDLDLEQLRQTSTLNERRRIASVRTSGEVHVLVGSESRPSAARISCDSNFRKPERSGNGGTLTATQRIDLSCYGGGWRESPHQARASLCTFCARTRCKRVPFGAKRAHEEACVLLGLASGFAPFCTRNRIIHPSFPLRGRWERQETSIVKCPFFNQFADPSGRLCAPNST